MNRREFLGNVLRNIILSGILVVTGYLLFKEKNEESCDFDFLCKNCKKLNTCTLPESIKFKPG
jgi:hypothetical protein